MRIALVTSFSPEFGGGSVQFRSLLPRFSDLDIEWFYLADKAVSGPRLCWLGKPLSSLQLASDLFARSGFLPGSRTIVRTVVERIPADLYWVVAHNEGVSLAAELCAMGKRVHLTIHDDPVCMFRRSRKHRALASLMARQFSKLLRSVDSIDVISSNMRAAYRQKYNVESIAVYRYVPELPRLVYSPMPGTLTIGHIGSVYHPEPFRQFLSACLAYAGQTNHAVKVVRIGSSPELDAVAAGHPDLFDNRGELDEGQAVPLLGSCHMLYAMYPPGRRFACFRQTSLPMKLSTYIQAQRPIFAHTPPDSGLAQLISKHGVGTVCSSNREVDIRQAVQAILDSRISRENFDAIRDDLMGPRQLQQLRDALQSRSSSLLP
jgi:hypothetical protein